VGGLRALVSLRASAGGVVGAVLLLALVSCTSETPGPTGLSGVWSVSIEDGDVEVFGVGAEIVLGFAGSSGGTGWLRIDRARSGVRSCDRFVFGFDDELTIVSPFTGARVYEVAEDGDDFLLSGDGVELRLSRVVGADPRVVPCATAKATLVTTFDRELHNASRLSGHGGALYFNREAYPSVIQRYDVNTGSLTEVVYSEPFQSQYRIIMAVSDAETFYAHCFCGNTDDVLAFDASANVSFASFSTTTLAAPFSVSYGERIAPGLIALGGHSRATGTQRIAVLSDADLTVVSEGDLLADAHVWDIAVLDGQTYALVGGYGPPVIVRVGDGNVATASADVPGLAGLFPVGIASAGGALYVIGSDRRLDQTYLFSVELP
jgi:hypothetical protein